VIAVRPTPRVRTKKRILVDVKEGSDCKKAPEVQAQRWLGDLNKTPHRQGWT